MSSVPPSRSVVCSVICLHPVIGTSWGAADRVVRQQRFNALINRVLAGIAPADRMVLPLGDGVAIGCLRDPESALAVALRLQEAMDTRAIEPLPVGIHLGSMQSVDDVNGMPRLFGEGMQIAEGMMRAAVDGEVLVSRAFYESIAYISDDHKTAFEPAKGYTDRQGLHREAARLGTAAPALRERLEALFSAAAVPASPPVAAGPPLTTQQQVLKTISTWFMPFNALAAFVGLSITGLERLAPGGSLTRVAFFVSISVALALALLDVAQSLRWPRRYWARPGTLMNALASRAASVLGAVVTVMFGVGVLVLSQPAAPTATVAPAVVVPAPRAPSIVTTAAPPPASRVAAAPISTPAEAQPQPVSSTPRKNPPAQPTVKAETAARRPPEPAPQAAPAVPRQRDAGLAARCSDIVMQGSLGTALSDNERETLRTQCR